MLAKPTIDALQTIVVPFSAGLPLRNRREAPALEEKVAPAQPYGTVLRPGNAEAVWLLHPVA